jgi:hypothetical protein
LSSGHLLHIGADAILSAKVKYQGRELFLLGNPSDVTFATECVRYPGLQSPLELIGDRAVLRIPTPAERLMILLRYVADESSLSGEQR